MPRPRFRVLLGMVGVGLVILALHDGWLNGPLGLARVGFAPVEWSITNVGETVGGVVWSFLRVGTLSRRVRTLEEELARLRAEQAREASLQQENAELRQALRLLPRTRFRHVAADVTGVSTDGASAVLRINRGANDRIPTDAAVIAADGVVVGHVSSVQTSTATVELLTGGKVRVAARALDTGAEGIVHGVRGLDVIFDGIPRTQTLRVGDRLVTTGLDGNFPPYLLLGTVVSVRALENAIFQEASVQLPLDLHRLKVVAVLLES
ncbi:MAG: rod shape-determining protein MreC [Parcubacteria group bacterium Gr01-1014_38]|nr:MAG: rod shape-determining protein MreC [Parcubacteria group bacterium Gr01-1014_38]